MITRRRVLAGLGATALAPMAMAHAREALHPGWERIGVNAWQFKNQIVEDEIVFFPRGATYVRVEDNIFRRAALRRLDHPYRKCAMDWSGGFIRGDFHRNTFLEEP